MPIQFILEFDLVVCRCKYNNPSVSVGVLVWVCNRNNQSIMHLGIVTMSQEEFGTVWLGGWLFDRFGSFYCFLDNVFSSLIF